MAGAQSLILKKYGFPGKDYQAKYCELWHVKNDFPWFPAEKVFINRDFKIALVKAFQKLEEKGLHIEIKTEDGCFQERTVRGFPDKVSLHSWAMAMDMNAKENPMHKSPTPELRKGKWSQEFIDTMKSEGIYFGGEFTNRADPMHWALYNG